MSNVDGDTPELAMYYDKISDAQYNRGVSLVDMMKMNSGDAVLDVGCGTGRLALYVSGIVGSSGSVIGIDPSPHRIEVANGKLSSIPAPNVCFMVGEGEDLSGLPDGCFDDAYYCAVFHWISDKKTALREAYRVLRPGGKVGITSMDHRNSLSVKGIINDVLARHPEIDGTRRTSTGSIWASKEELEALLSEAGFKDITMSAMTTKSYFQSPKEYFGFLKASSFGQPSRVPEYLRIEVRDAIVEELEKRRTPRGIEIESYPLLAVAAKPR